MYEVGGRIVDLTNYTARAQLRKHKGSTTSVSFTVGFPNRIAGKVKLSVPSWQTSRLKPGRYVYDILFTKPAGTQEIVLEGTVNVRAGISTSCFGGGTTPGSAHRLCIAVIDESSSQSTSSMTTKWAQFRSTYPKRTFYLLQPTAEGFSDLVDNTNYDALRCPDNFLDKTSVNVSPLI